MKGFKIIVEGYRWLLVVVVSVVLKYVAGIISVLTSSSFHRAPRVADIGGLTSIQFTFKFVNHIGSLKFRDFGPGTKERVDLQGLVIRDEFDFLLWIC